jgi:hypothetical protein
VVAARLETKTKLEQNRKAIFVPHIRKNCSKQKSNQKKNSSQIKNWNFQFINNEKKNGFFPKKREIALWF